MRLFLRILAGVAGLLLLLLIAVAIAIWTIDVNDFIGPIQARVKEATGRDLAIRGGIDFKLSLEPKLVLEDVTLGNVAWGKQPQMLTAKRVEAQVALLPLLQRHFEVVQFKLIDPTIALETDASGRGNWDFAAAASAASAGPAPATVSASGIGAFGIADLAITNGELTYLQGSTGDLTTVTIDSLTLHAHDPQSPLTGSFRGKVNDISLALEGDFGPLASLTQRRWPYPISMHGQINGQNAAVSAQASATGGAVGLDDLNVTLGSSSATGNLKLAPGPTRPQLSIKLVSPKMSYADMPAFGAAVTAATTVAQQPTRKGQYAVSSTPTSIAGLKTYDADGDFSIEQLTLPEGRRLDKVRAKFTVRDGVLDAPNVQATAFGGTLVSQLKIDTANAAAPSVAFRLDGKQFDLAALLAAAGVQTAVTGGKTNLTINVTTIGLTQKDWLANANGTVLATIGPAQVPAATLNIDPSYLRLLETVNPFRKVDPVTQLECAVVRLPLRGGVATVDRSIAMETAKLGASASGTLDFRSETLDLTFKPQFKQGIKIDLIDVAKLVRLTGPFASPTVQIDAAGSAATVARVGAAVSTGGLSVVGESLLSNAKSGGPGPCQVALGASDAQPAAATASTSSGSANTGATNSVGKAIGKLFGR